MKEKLVDPEEQWVWWGECFSERRGSSGMDRFGVLALFVEVIFVVRGARRHGGSLGADSTGALYSDDGGVWGKKRCAP